MSAGHFFVGLGAGIAILAVPVLVLTPGSSVPQHLIEWIEGPDPHHAQVTQATAPDAAVTRPLRGYQPGDPTPAPQSVPTIQALIAPAPTVAPTPAPVVNAPPLASLRWQGTAVIHSGGVPVYVRRVAGVESSDDPQLPDASPVLVSSGPPLQIGSQQWRAVRGLNGVVGWVPSTQLAIDGEAPVLVGATPTPAATDASASNRGIIGNTDGTGVVLRRSPKDTDRTTSGLMDGTRVTVLEASGADWLHVRADNGLTGWVPTRYVQGAN